MASNAKYLRHIRGIERISQKAPACRIPRLRRRDGRCFELAFRGCLRAQEWTLVHGECNGPPGVGSIIHAWLEFDGHAYCPTNDLLLPVEEYERVFGAVARYRYSFQEASRKLAEYRRYGPWELTTAA